MNIDTMPLAHQEHLINSMSKELNKRFCDDRKIPLKIYSGDIFIDRLKLFGEYENYINYCQEIRRMFDDTQKYFEYYNQVKDKAIDYIKGSETFQLLNSDDMNKYACKYNFPQSDVYKASNIGKRFISIDMSKANFSALVAYGRTIGTEFFKNFNYREFMEQFTDVEHIINSKYIRQVIFGNCNPKRQVTYEKYLMSLLLERILSEDSIYERHVSSLCSDEIILKADEFSTDDLLKIKEIVDEMSSIIPLKLEYYQLGKVEGSDAYIKKIFSDLEYELTYTYDIKCVNPDEAPFIYRLIKNQPIKDEDSIFNYNKKLAKLIETPELSINFTGGYN